MTKMSQELETMYFLEIKEQLLKYTSGLSIKSEDIEVYHDSFSSNWKISAEVSINTLCPHGVLFSDESDGRRVSSYSEINIKLKREIPHESDFRKIIAKELSYVPIMTDEHYELRVGARGKACYNCDLGDMRKHPLSAISDKLKGKPSCELIENIIIPVINEKIKEDGFTDLKLGAQHKCWSHLDGSIKK